MPFSSFFDCRRLLSLLIIVLILSCKQGKDIPDVSKYKAEVAIQRFDTAFFNIDTLAPGFSLNRLNETYPQFLPGYMSQVVGIMPTDPQAAQQISAFINSYKPIAARANEVWNRHGQETAQQIAEALKFAQHYLPKFRPEQPFIITPFIGPMNAYEAFSTGDYGEVRTTNGVGIALQLHLGANDPVYEEGIKAGLFHQYQTRRFVPGNMSINAVKTIIDDLYPYKNAGYNLLEDMVEKGRRLYLLDHLMPFADDSLKIGYTGPQLKGAEANESLIWNYFVKNDLLYSKDPMVNQNYIKDGPSTPELGEGAPGYIGLWLGRQIVRSYMDNNKEVTMDQLMAMQPAQIFAQAGYKP